MEWKEGNTYRNRGGDIVTLTCIGKHALTFRRSRGGEYNTSTTGNYYFDGEEEMEQDVIVQLTDIDKVGTGMDHKEVQFRSHTTDTGEKLYVAASLEKQDPLHRLPAGIYRSENIVPMSGTPYTVYHKVDIISDSIVEIPDPIYQRITSEINHFLSPETKTKYEEMGVTYKRSCLLYGIPGVGKTVITNRIAQMVVEGDGIVLCPGNNDDLGDITAGLKSLGSRTKLVLFEEFDSWIDDMGEKNLLRLLDGQVQSSNTIYLATTNYIDKIPSRLMRPGRFSSILEMGTPNTECRVQYIASLLPKASLPEVKEMASKTGGLVIDEIREAVLATILYGRDMDEVLEDVKKYNSIGNRTETMTTEDLQKKFKKQLSALYSNISR